MAGIRTARRLLLGREIAHMIERAGLSQAEAAKLIESSQSRIAGLLSGQGNITVGDLELLATKLGFSDPGYLETLRELRRDSHKRGSWNTGYNRTLAEDLRLFVDLQKHADNIRWSEVEVVPGLLQCESYVRAQYADETDDGEVTVEDRIQARLSQQAILDGANVPMLQFVLSESCLRRMWADSDVMREQLHHLVSLSNRPNIMIQVMPFKQPIGRRSAIAYRFIMLRVPSPGVAGPIELAYTDGAGQLFYMDDKRALDAHENAWARRTSAALSFAESRDFIRQTIQEEFAP